MTEYEKYQLQWMISHGYSLRDLISELTQMQYDDPEDSDRISTPISELFDEWVADVGFGSEIWACEAEWRGCEGAEKPSMYPYQTETHRLKIWPRYFEAVCDGRKTFEVRVNDRGFRVGDKLELQEWHPTTGEYTGRSVVKEVVYMVYGSSLDPKLERYVIMAIK